MSPSTQDNQERYMRTLLRLYLATPGVAGHVRRADRQMARALYSQKVPLYAVADAFVVAAARRIRHNAFATPLPPIQSLHYFRNVIKEILDRPPGYRDIERLRDSLRRHY
jgi:hypothetical protein